MVIILSMQSLTVTAAFANKPPFPPFHTALHLWPAHIHQQIRSLAATRKVRHVGVGRQRLRNLAGCLNLSDLDQTITRLGNGPADGLGTLGFTLGTNNVGLSLLLGLLDDEPRPLGILLCDLLLLDGLGELLAEGHVGDGHILERDVELLGALDEIGPDPLRDSFTLGNELCRIELGNNGLEDFVADRGQNTLVVVLAERLGGERNTSATVTKKKHDNGESILPGRSWEAWAHLAGAEL